MFVYNVLLILQVASLHNVTAMCWSPDSTSVILGTLSGGVMLYSACLKRALYRDNYEITHTTTSTASIVHPSSGISADVCQAMLLAIASRLLELLKSPALGFVLCWQVVAWTFRQNWATKSQRLTYSGTAMSSPEQLKV